MEFFRQFKIELILSEKQGASFPLWISLDPKKLAAGKNGSQWSPQQWTT